VKKILGYAAIATIAAAALNALIYIGGEATGVEFVVPKGPEQTPGTLGLPAIVGVTAGSMVVGTLVYLGLTKITSSRAWAIFLALAALLTLGSFLPFGGDWALEAKLWLAPMHFIAPGALIFALWRARRSSIEAP
jgi:hypothetical protein